MKVQDQSDEVKALMPDWALADALMGGTRAMRKAGKVYLPQWPKESQEKYERRLAQTTLLPTFQRTVRVMSAKPFSKPITLGDDVPARVKKLLENVDRQGNSLHSFSSDLMPRTLSHGLQGVLVDHPSIALGSATMADAAGAEPYFVWIPCQRILGWRLETIEGAVRLTQLRISEAVEVPSGDFGTAVVDRVRVLEPGLWRLYEKPADATDYVLGDEGLCSTKEIPFVPFFGVKDGPMTGHSPLLELAYLNVKHWQSQSDQDNLLHVARVPILFAKGFDETDEIEVGTQHAVRTENVEAALVYVEHTGDAIGAGQTSLEALERQMLQIGAELLIAKPGGTRTATESNNEADANKSDLQRFAEQFEDSLDRCLGFMAEYLGEKTGGHVTLFKDYLAATLTDASAQLIVTMAQGGMITKETALREQQRRGVLSSDIDPATEVQAAKDEAPTMVDGATGLDDGGGAGGVVLRSVPPTA